MKSLLTLTLLILVALVAFNGCSTQDTTAPIEPTPIESQLGENLWPKNKGYQETADKIISAFFENLETIAFKDLDKFCPEFKNFDLEKKKDFFNALLSFMAKYESNFEEKKTFKEPFRDRSGKRVVSSGLLQVSIESCRGYGTDLDNRFQLLEPEKNLECSVRILSRWSNRDNYIASKVNGKWKGCARYWAVLRDGNRGHDEIVNLSRSFCRGDD